MWQVAQLDFSSSMSSHRATNMLANNLSHARDIFQHLTHHRKMTSQYIVHLQNLNLTQNIVQNAKILNVLILNVVYSETLFFGPKPWMSPDPASLEMQTILQLPPLREHSRVLSSNFPFSKPKVPPEKLKTIFSYQSNVSN